MLTKTIRDKVIYHIIKIVLPEITKKKFKWCSFIVEEEVY